MKTTAVIVAAGSGRRLGAAIPKAFMLLAGKPILEHSLQAFQAHAEVDAVILVVSADRMAEAREIARRYGKVAAVTEGGRRRQDSVRRGLECIAAGAPGDDVVLVHDAARPLVDADIISAVRKVAARGGAAVPGIRPADTLRRVEPQDATGATIAAGRIDRDRCVLVQTPQGFRLDLLREAFERAGEEDVTDDAALLERLGIRVEVIPGSPRNFKITTDEDLRAAEGILS